MNSCTKLYSILIYKKKFNCMLFLSIMILDDSPFGTLILFELKASISLQLKKINELKSFEIRNQSRFRPQPLVKKLPLFVFASIRSFETFFKTCRNVLSKWLFVQIARDNWLIYSFGSDKLYLIFPQQKVVV